MADILITNIDFPKGKEALALEVNRHGEVFVFYRDEASGRVAPLKRRESNAIEIPPHGELIDKSVLGKMLDERISYCVREANLSEKEKDMVRWVQSIICGVFSDAPTW